MPQLSGNEPILGLNTLLGRDKGNNIRWDYLEVSCSI
jgi:hypothetical protein